MTHHNPESLKADIAVIGGGTGGVAAALAAAKNGSSVILTEETDWIGGQLTTQAVPPDEHPWIESFGCTRSYREFRDRIRAYYAAGFPLSTMARQSAYLNPGNATVTQLAFDPRVGLSVLHSMLAPYLADGRIRLLLLHKAVRALCDGDRIQAIEIAEVTNGYRISIEADIFIDATELGDLLPLTGAEYVTGAESVRETGEMHAPSTAQPNNIQAMTACFAVEYCPGEDHTIEKPAEYSYWKDSIPNVCPAWPGRQLSWTYSHPVDLSPRTPPFNPEQSKIPDDNAAIDLWTYRRIHDRRNFDPIYESGDVSLVNWPQNDYLAGHLIDATPEAAQLHIQKAHQLSLSLLYWMQTEAPRPDGGTGWPGLRLRKDITGTTHGLAKFPYIRESRRMRARFTVLEQHVSAIDPDGNAFSPSQVCRPARFPDSVGVGCYRIDLHPSTGGDNYIDLPTVPFEIPLGSLIPQRLVNLLPGAKNAGVTHITNGCFRLHPVEWNIGEAAGLLGHFCRLRKSFPAQVHEKRTLFVDFQMLLIRNGVEVHWPELHPV